MELDDVHPMIDKSVSVSARLARIGLRGLIGGTTTEYLFTISLSCFVDANHAGDLITRRSHTGICFLYERCSYCLVQHETEWSWKLDFRKRVGGGADRDWYAGRGIALHVAHVWNSVKGPTNLFCDNRSVVLSATKPEGLRGCRSWSNPCR